MQLQETQIPGCKLIRLEPLRDARGEFVRTWCRQTMLENGIDLSIVQCSVSTNIAKGTLRGLHFQKRPYGERKLVRCIRGRLFDVVVDLRTDSPSYRKWQSFELSADDEQVVYIPKGCAHGFLTLEENTQIEYMMGDVYISDAASGIRWDDPELNVEWPFSPAVISDRDLQLPGLSEISTSIMSAKEDSI